jgi:positive regulator of sigma E activity
MSDQNSIDHEGIVEAISGDVARVKIDAQSACAACHAKGVCTAADKEEKIMEVPLNGVSLDPGEKVRVLISRHPADHTYLSRDE